MAKKQARKSVSLARSLHARIVDEAIVDGVSLSEWITRLCIAELERRAGGPIVTLRAHLTFVDRAVVERAQANKWGRSR